MVGRKQEKEIVDILIITGGRLEAEYAKAYLQGKSFERIIAADAGLASLKKLSLVPTDILGDFDSLSDKSILKDYADQGIPVHSFPVRKDYTDTHLAVLCALDYHPDAITILGATGSRADHFLANVGLLQGLASMGIDGIIADRHNEISMLCGPAERVYRRNPDFPWFSLMAWGGDAGGIDLDGFSYPLHNAILSTDISLGISNELTEEAGTVKIKSGYLLVIRSSD